jgi:hypothetical protein
MWLLSHPWLKRLLPRFVRIMAGRPVLDFSYEHHGH